MEMMRLVLVYGVDNCLGGLVRGWIVCRCGFVNMVLRGGGGMEVV
jgi:hypothetical protein